MVNGMMVMMIMIMIMMISLFLLSVVQGNLDGVDKQGIEVLIQELQGPDGCLRAHQVNTEFGIEGLRTDAFGHMMRNVVARIAM